MGADVWKIRPYDPAGDEAFVNKTWKESYRYTGPESDWASRPPNAAGSYYREMNARVAELVKRSQVLVACNAVAPEHILGWCCVEGGVVHYVWVRQDWRRQGIARALLHAAGPVEGRDGVMTVSHWTSDCELVDDVVPLHYKPSAITARKERRAS